MSTANGAVNEVIEYLDTSFSLPNQVQEQALESTHISVDRIAKTIEAMAGVTADLDHLPRLELLHTLDPIIAKIPADERGPIETAIGAILKSGANVDKFMQAIPAPVAGPIFTPYCFDDLLSMPPKEWLIDRVVGKKDIGVIYGKPGCGKTFVGIDMIMAACTGALWAMRFAVAGRLNVAYCAGEGISGLPARFKAAAHHHGVTKLPNFTFFKTVPQLFSNEAESTVATIRQFVTEWKARQEQGQAEPLDLMFIDTLHTATVAADENSSQDMGKVLHACRWASNELGCAVILVHHTTKDGASERGSSSLRGAADFMIEVRRVSESGTKATMLCSKLKDGEQWPAQGLDLVSIDGLDSVRVWWDEITDGANDEDRRKSDTARRLLEVLIKTKGQRVEVTGATGEKETIHLPAALTAKQISEAVDAKPQTVNKVLGRLEKEGLISRSQNNRGTWSFTATDEGKIAFQDRDFA